MIDLEGHYLASLSYTDDATTVLGELMREYGDDVWRFAYFMTKSKDLADDISQDVFLNVYEKLYTYRGQCSIKSWLLTITRNRCLNVMKSFFLRKVSLVGWIFSTQTVRSAEHELFDRLETKHIWTCVMQLPIKFREPLLLESHYEMSMKDIAYVLGISEGTVKSRLHRARKKLQMILSEKEGE
ncbi:sigma-70 family RNA polymerase sigma factor [Paenibacillus sp. N1-5-1-14]|uniref:RNA polymerase sigma factor n=1 Tax=Paenibacillus radicibacter TaxID=2972488 RepID=UPI002159109F|nr:sigma-70 family RNA polymerase sigma factor [Paenibacillus radicibacter]MCR8641957.1 sigma-70 family RNA polymerase sigma factor [Paenibacillus radicibacter]